MVFCPRSHSRDFPVARDRIGHRLQALDDSGHVLRPDHARIQPQQRGLQFVVEEQPTLAATLAERGVLGDRRPVGRGRVFHQRELDGAGFVGEGGHAAGPH